MAKILTICSGEILSKFEIMTMANLNSKGVEKYLDILHSEGLLAQPGIEYFRTDSKGMAFLAHDRTIKSLLDELEVAS
jgi:predicted transcriptional regulator